MLERFASSSPQRFPLLALTILEIRAHAALPSPTHICAAPTHTYTHHPLAAGGAGGTAFAVIANATNSTVVQV